MGRNAVPDSAAIGPIVSVATMPNAHRIRAFARLKSAVPITSAFLPSIADSMNHAVTATANASRIRAIPMGPAASRLWIAGLVPKVFAARTEVSVSTTARVAGQPRRPVTLVNAGNSPMAAADGSTAVRARVGNSAGIIRHAAYRPGAFR